MDYVREIVRNLSLLVGAVVALFVLVALFLWLGEGLGLVVTFICAMLAALVFQSVRNVRESR